MKRAFSALFVLGILLPAFWVAGPALALDLENTMEILPRWKKGQKLHYTMTKATRIEQNGRTRADTKADIPVTVEVVSKNENGYVLGWTTGKPSSDTQAYMDPMAQSLMEASEGFTAFLDVNFAGRVTGVKNWLEYKKKADAQLDAIVDRMRSAGFSSGQLDAMMRSARAMVDTKDQLGTFFVKDPQTFLLALGEPVPLTEAVVYESSLPNPMGGDPLPASGRFWVEKSSADETVFGWSQQVDPVQGPKVLQKTLDGLRKSAGVSVPEASVKSFESKDAGTFTIERATGWPVSVDVTRTIRLGGTVRRETTKFRRDYLVPGGPARPGR